MHTPLLVHVIGDATVTRISEITPFETGPEALFTDWTPGMTEDGEPWFTSGSMNRQSGNMLLSIHLWVIKTSRHTILIDTGVGNGKSRPLAPRFNNLQTPVLERLAAAGASPEQVDYVFLTHLHVDHVGWNTCLERGRWTPTFPRAKYVFTKSGQAFYSDPASYAEPDKLKYAVYQDSVLPVLDAGQAELVEPDGREFLEGIALHPVDGHCVGQMAVSFTSRGQEALFVGDAAHHPLQVLYPEMNSVWCVRPEQARASRLWSLDYAAARRAVYFGGHFPGTSAGLVTRENGRYAWRYVQPAQTLLDPRGQSF